MCHFRILSTLLVVRISQVPLPFHNSIENTAVIALPGDKNRPCWRHYFQMAAAPNPNCFSNHGSSHHFSPEMVPLFPLRHTANGIQQQKTLSSELPRFFRALASRLLPQSFELFRFIFRTAVRLDLVGPEPFFPLGLNVLSAVGHGKGTIQGGGLRQSQEESTCK
jgi:hypothetical protein